MLDHRLVVLRTFAVAGTLGATADALGYSPSAVSTQLREYQRALGVRLVEKDGRGLRLTPAGHALVDRADDLVALWEGIYAELRDKSTEAVPTLLRLGGFSTATGSLLSPAAAALSAKYPSLDVHIIEADPQRCLELLVADRLDVAVVVAMQATPQVNDRRLEQLTLIDDPLDVLLPRDHPLAGREAIELEELAGESWITDRPGTPYRALFVTGFTATGVIPQVVHQVSDWGSQEALVGHGLGVAFIPRLMRLSPESGAVRVRLDPASAPSRRILAVVRRGTQSHALFAEALETLHQMAVRYQEPTPQESAVG
ncbi:MAG: LysR family transcriptional regulator [Micrococcaceae bacterium]